MKKFQANILKRLQGNLTLTQRLQVSARRRALFQVIVDKIFAERVRQGQLLREGKIDYDCASPGVSHDLKLRVLMEELGEVAREIDQLDRVQTRANFRTAARLRKENLKVELIQVAAVAVAFVESLEVEK